MATEPSFLVIKIKPVFGGSGEPGEAQSWVAQGDCMRALWAKDVIALRARGCAPTGNRRCCSRHHLVTAGSRGGAKNSGMAVASLDGLHAECGEHSDDVTRGPTDVHPREVVRFATRRSSVPHRDGRFDGCAKRIRRRSGGRGCGGGMLAGLICLVLPVSQAARYTAISDRRCSRSSQHHPQPAGSAPVRLRVLSGCCCGRCTRVPDEAVNLGLSGAWRRYLDM